MTRVSLLKSRQGKRLLKYFQTFFLLMAGITMGLVLVLVGPTLLDLADLLNVSVREITFVAFGGDFGCFFGSAIAALLFKYFSAQKIIIFCALLIGVSNTLIPHGQSPLVTAGLTCLTGTGVGVVEIGAYVWLVGMWPENVAPITQMLHLSYGIGAFMSPLIAEPYLRHHENQPLFNQTDLNQTDFLDEYLDGSYDNKSYVDSVPEITHESRVHIPYALIGAFAIFNASLMIVSFCVDSSDVKPEKPAKEEEARLPTSKAYQWTLVSLIGFYTMVLVVSEVTVGKFLPAYVVQHYNLNRSNAAYLVSLFYIGFTFGRVIAVPISVRFSPMQMMNASQLGLVTSAALLTFINNDQNVLWVCSFTLGLSLSPLFGCATAWLSRHVVLSHDFMSTVMTIVTFGALVPPLFIGSYLETHPYILTWFILLSACSMVLISFILHSIATFHKKVYSRCPVNPNDEMQKLEEV